MNPDAAKAALALAKAMQDDVNAQWLPPTEVLPSRTEAVLPSMWFKRANRNYLVMVVHQINRTYENACYDACAVMVRRLVESLIIEAFEAKGLDAEIKGQDDNFYALSVLVDKTEQRREWNLSRNAKKALKNFKTTGDVSAHNRRYIAPRHDIDELILPVRHLVSELLTIAGLK